MAGDYLPVAELLATLGLDSTDLVMGIRDARIKLQDIKPDILSVNQYLAELTATGRVTGALMDSMTASIQRAWQNQKELTQARKNDAIAERERISEVKASLASELASKKEYAQLTKQFRDQEIAEERQLLAEKQAERSRYQAWWNRTLKEQAETETVVYRNQGLAQLGFDGEVTEKKILNQRAIAAASIQASEVSYAGQRTVALEGMAANKILGTDIPWSMTRLISSVPAVASVMSSVFDLVLAAAFIDILYQVSSKIDELTNDWKGFGEEAKHAWTLAREGVNDTRKALIDLKMLQLDQKYEENKTSSKRTDKAQWDELRDVEKKKVLQDDLNKRTEVLLTLRKSLDALDKGAEVRDSLKTKVGFGASILAYSTEELKARLALYQSGLTEAEQRAEIEKELKQIQQASLDINKMGYTIDKDRTREIEKAVAVHDKKRRDEVHELPYRLPWFMGVDPASAFAAQMQGLQTAGINPSQQGPQSIRPVNIPSAPRQTTAEHPVMAQAASGGGSSGRDIILQVTYAPVFQVENMGDVEAVMRDKIEPKFIEDMKNNTRGLRAEIIAALKRGQ